jgi:hypothetical protein
MLENEMELIEYPGVIVGFNTTSPSNINNQLSIDVDPSAAIFIYGCSLSDAIANSAMYDR